MLKSRQISIINIKGKFTIMTILTLYKTLNNYIFSSRAPPNIGF